jgi:dihydrofolate synthase/folylpolyglutamate synthase
MTYSEALTFLGEARRFGMKLGLENMLGLAKELGNPHNDLKFIHIAGTNGKGSTAAFCANVLKESGHRVGLYTSPHLIQLGERIQVNGIQISKERIAEGLELIKTISESKNLALTFFEIVTGLALWYFKNEKVDIVVWETGLGGRLDATNIVIPEVSIITRIAKDHTQYLGTELSQIAAEKAGIIKPKVPVVSAPQEKEVKKVIEKVAQEKSASLQIVGDNLAIKDLNGGSDFGDCRSPLQSEYRIRIGDQSFSLGLVGSHQVENAGCAYLAMQVLKQKGWKISDDSIKRGLETVSWPGRFQFLSKEPVIVLDGAHNPDGLKQVLKTWKEIVGSEKFHLVFGMVSDKDSTELTTLLAPFAKTVSCIKLTNERAMSPKDLLEKFNSVPHFSYENWSQAWPEVKERAKSCPTLIAGSLFLVGEALSTYENPKNMNLELNELLSANR